MHTYKFLANSSLILLLCSVSPSQASPATELSLDSPQAVALALKQNHSLRASRSAIGEAAAHLRYAGELPNPELKLSYTSDYTFNDEGERGFTLGFEQRFPISNRLKLLKNASALEVKLAQAELRNQERLLVRDVQSAVDHLLSLQQRLQLRQEMLNLQQNFATFLAKRIEQGEASTLDLNQVEVSLFSIHQEIQKLTKQSQQSTGELRNLLGINHTVAIHIPSQPARIESLPPMPVLSPSSLSSHPEYQLQTLLAQIVESQTALAVAERWADIAVEVFLEEERAIDEPSGLQKDRFLGISLSIPLPINNQNRGAIAASHLREKKIRQQLSALELRLLNEAETLRQQAAASYQQAATYQANAIDLVEKNVADINRAYAAGQVDLGQVFRVQEKRLSIKTAQLELWHELKQTLIQWEAVTASQHINLSPAHLSYETY